MSAAENLSSPHNSSGIDGVVVGQGEFLHRVTNEPIPFTFSYMENSSEGQIPNSELRGIASQTIDSALQIPFLQRLNGRLVDENGQLMRTSLQFSLPDETVSLQASQTPQGRDLWISVKDGFVNLSDRTVAVVDVKKPDGNIMQSTQQAVEQASQFLAEIDEKIGEVEPEIPLVEKIESEVNIY